MTEPTKVEDTTASRDEDVQEREGRARFDTDAPLFKQVGYVEDPDWEPSPYDQFGTVQTAGTAGDDVHGTVSEVSPAFAIGRARNLVHAARALDPDDPTSPDLVILPGADHRDEDTAREEVFRAAQRHIDNPVEIGMTDARRRAAETDDPDATADVYKREDDDSGEPPVGSTKGTWTKQEETA